MLEVEPAHRPRRVKAMSYRISLRLAVAILTGATLFPLTVLGQSQDQPSVADAARRAREQKKAAAKQPAPVITDDTLKRSAPSDQDASAPAAQQPSEAASGSAQASQPSPNSASAPNGNAAAAPGEKPAAPGADADQKTQASAELAALKLQVADAQKGLELVQRELALQQDTYFSNPDHARDIAGKAKLDGTQQQVADKQQEVNDLKARLAALQASGSAPPAAPAAPPQS